MSQHEEFQIATEDHKELLDFLVSGRDAFGACVKHLSAEKRQELLGRLNDGWPLMLFLQMMPQAVFSCAVQPPKGDPVEVFSVVIQFAPSIAPGELLH